jgi:CheY-like chemotaxis protein
MNRYVILVAEDYDDTLSLMKMLLQSKGHLVVEAANGQEAMELTTQGRLNLHEG